MEDSFQDGKADNLYLLEYAFESLPELLVLEYCDLPGHPTIEWLIFQDRFSAAIFTYRATKILSESTAAGLNKKLNNLQNFTTVSRGETELLIEEQISFYEVTLRISGATAI